MITPVKLALVRLPPVPTGTGGQVASAAALVPTDPKRLHRDESLVPPPEDRSVLPAMLFEPLTATVITTVSATPQDKKLAGYLVLAGNQLRVWGPRQEAFNRVRDELKTRSA